MLKYANYDIVFQEFPDEVTLAINLSLCPNHCPQCHSQQLWNDIGEPLTEKSLSLLIEKYSQGITCVALMGGDNDPLSVLRLLKWVRCNYKNQYKTGWYSGRTWLPSAEQLSVSLNYLKIGPYIANRGPLNKPTTNQRFFRVDAMGKLIDMTSAFWKKRR